MNEKDSTAGYTETEKIVIQHSEQLYAEKVWNGHTDEMDTFLENCKLRRNVKWPKPN